MQNHKYHKNPWLEGILKNYIIYLHKYVSRNSVQVYNLDNIQRVCNLSIKITRIYIYFCQLFLRDTHIKCILFDCLFVDFCPIRESFTHMKHQHYQWRSPMFDLYLAQVVTEQWGFFKRVTITVTRDIS